MALFSSLFSGGLARKIFDIGAIVVFGDVFTPMSGTTHGAHKNRAQRHLIFCRPDLKILGVQEKSVANLMSIPSKEEKNVY
jgi:hypothetical protein